MSRISRKEGFTLIELLVVIAIIAILAAILAQPYVKNWDVFKCPSWSRSILVWYPQPQISIPLSYLYNKTTPEAFSWQLTPSFQGKHGFLSDHSYGALNEAKVEDPAGTIWLVEGGARSTADVPLNDRVYWAGQQIAYGIHHDYNDNDRVTGRRVGNPHFNGFTAVFGDGHAKWVRWRSTKPSMWTVQAD
jgi:prepilin-type N-terminal cleavage/methylation domain-containing protein